MSAGFVSVPVVPTFKGMSKEFSQRLEKPAQESGKRAGEAMTKGLESAVENIERQVKASSSKLKDLDHAYEVSVGKRAAQQEKLEAVTLRLQDAEEKYQKALEKGGKGTAELAKVKAAKASVIGETEKLEQAEIDVRVAEEKHKNQLEDLNNTLAKLQDSQSELNRELEKSGGAFGGAKDKIQSMADSAKNGAAKFGEFAEKYKIHATAALGGIGLIAKESMAYAAEAEQSYGAVESIFADHAQGIIDKSKQAATEVGVSGREYRELSANMGAMLKNMGMPMDEVADKSQNLVGVAADLAATFGGTTKEAVESVTSLLRGETDPIEKYGVSIKQADIEARMAADGLDNLSGEAEKQAKAQTLLKLLTEQTASAQGQFARETDTAAHKQQVATAKYNDAKEAIGTALLPIMSELADKAASVAQVIGEHPAIFIAVAGAVGTLSAAIVGAAMIAPVLTAWSAAATAANTSMMGLAASTIAAIAPVVAVIAAVAALGVALWAFFTKTETGREIWETFTTFLSDAWDKAVEKVTKGIEWLKDTLSELWGYLSTGDFKGLLENMFGMDTDSSLFKGLVWLKDFITGSLAESFAALRESAGKLVEILVSLGKSVGGALLNVLKGLWDLIGPLLVPTLKVLGAIIGGVIVGSIMAAVKVIEYAAKLFNVLLTAVQWLIDNALVPLIDIIGNLVGGFLSGVIPALQAVAGFIGGVFMGAWNLLSEGISWVWENVIQPVFNAILQVAKATVGVIGTLVLAPFLIAWNVLSAGIQAAWETVIKPVWEAIADFAQNTLWPIMESVFGWMGEKWQQFADLMGVVWGWLRDNIFTPFMDGLSALAEWFQARVDDMVAAWQWFQGLMQTGWQFIDSYVLAPLRFGLQVVADWFRARVDDMLAIWQGFQNLLQAGWQFVNQYVFQPFKGALDTMQSWFRTTVDAIGRIWDGIKEKTKAPVQFVVDVVYNNGIRKAWNAVAGLVGLDKLQEIKFATGGILPGYTPGRDPYTFIEPRTGMRIGLSGGEGILRPEATRALGKDWLDNVNAAARKGGVSAVRERLKHSHFANGGIIDLGNFAKGGFTNLAGALSAIQQSHAKFVSRFFPGMFTLTSASRSEPGSMHDFSRAAATDWQAADGQYATQMPTPASKALARAIHKNFPNTTQLIHHPLDGWQNLLNGAPFDYGPGTNSQHGNHVHWGTNSPLRFDGDDIVLDDVAGEGGGGWNPINMVKRLWDGIVSKIGEFPGAEKFGEWGKLPGAMAKKLIDAAWEFVSGKAAKEEAAFQGDPGAGVEQWRPMVEAVLKDKGFPLSLANSVLRRMNQESGGNARAINDWDINAQRGTPSKGLMQVIDPTFQAHKDPGYDNIWDPEANLRASMNYAVATYGSLPAAYDRAGGYALGGIVDLMKLYDQGGWLEHGKAAFNMSGKPEPVLNHDQWTIITQMIRSGASMGDVARELGRLVPALQDQAEAVAKFADNAQAWMAKTGDYNSTEGINARQTVRRVLDLGLDLPGSEQIRVILDGEKALWDSRARAVGHTEALAEKEQALADAKKKLHELETGEVELSVKDKRKLADAEKALAEAQAEAGESTSSSATAADRVADAEDALAKARESGDAEKVAKAEEKLSRAREKSTASSEKANDKVAKAEEKLSRVREDLGIKQEEDEAKRAEEIEKANEAVTKAEGDLVAARKKQAEDLDNVVLLSQRQIEGLIPQAEGLASKLIGMGAPAQAVNAGLGMVVGKLASLAGLAGPTGLTLGMAMDMLKVGISIIKSIVEAIVELVNRIRKARLEALKALADGWAVIADYANLVVELQGRVTSLQQALIRGANAQREAEYNLMLAQHDRYIAEADGALRVAEARLALDEEIRRGAVAAQLKLLGLHEDWDSYMAYQALEAQGVLKEWSDSAISALFTYEKARAEALKGEVTARLEQIKAEAALAEAQRQNVRNQQDLLVAQERLIRMSAKVAGVDLVEATGTAQVAKLMAEMAEVKQAMDKNVLGRWGVGLGANGSYANEYRGQQAQYESLQRALDAVLAETGVKIDRGSLDRTLKLMGRAAFRGGDAMAVLRAQMPELAQAETALRVNEALKPVQEARDQQADLARQVEDFTAEIGLYEKTSPLERTLKGLDYTIQSLEQASAAFADGNEKLRGEYLAAARANHAAAQSAGVDWKLDSKYATPGVRDQVTKEVTIHMEGNRTYTADEVDALLREITAGSNVTYKWDKSSTKVAAARRKERI
ncbi:transglycosylase SLT domain-containing protein [Corynebacterium phoceense]|uniref:transglycosylase SLT domain-containing protein n=1 Tax=Corynebacterium phoceense TaxID=1686286 RepID=UPI000839C8DB|nr:transglycosylase SLT domain-containing protein [Corynebacterium phoceense]